MWTIDRDRVLSAAEVIAVIAELRRKARRTKTTRRNLILFELATCCGLRVSELCGLRLKHIRVGLSPSIRITADIAKGGKARTVPLLWDVDALADIVAWLALRRADGADDESFVLTARSGRPLERKGARLIYLRACRNILGRAVTIHAGRHTYVSYALRMRSPLAVRDACGHSNLSVTNAYAHLVEADERPGSLFAASNL